MKTGYVGYRFLTIYFLFFIVLHFLLWYITHFSCRWFHQWRRLWSIWLKVVQVSKQGMSSEKGRDPESESSGKTKRKSSLSSVSNARNDLHFSTPWKFQTGSLALMYCVKISAVARWNENHGSRSAERWHLSFGVFVCAFLKPYCNYFFLHCF